MITNFLKCRRILNVRFYVDLPSEIEINSNKEENQEGRKNLNQEKIKESNREYYLQNKEKIKEYKRKYYLQNKEKMNEYHRQYSLENKEKLKELKREYIIQNKEKIRKSKRNYYLQNKEKIKKLKQEYYIQNKEKIKENHQDYTLSNKEKIKHSYREYYLQNRDKIKKSKRQYFLRNKEKMNEYLQKYNLQNRSKIKQSFRKYYLQNKDKIKENTRKYYHKSQNKEKIKQLNIKKNIERNNGIYIPRYSWKSDDSVSAYFQKIEPLLHIHDLSDWYRISREQILELKGSGLFQKFSSLGEALKVAYPEYDWDMSKFSFRGKKSTQRWLYVKLKKLLPNAVIEEEYHHPELLWEDNKKSIQLDIWVSQYNLALEYQGEHHYYDLPGAYGPGSTIQIFNERDEKKKQLCASKGINLVCIPYWWDGHEDSLSSTLHPILPDVFQKTDSPPIPANLPTTKDSTINRTKEINE